LVAAAKFLVAATKILFVVPNFVAVTKPFFPRNYIFSSSRAHPWLHLIVLPTLNLIARIF